MLWVVGGITEIQEDEWMLFVVPRSFQRQSDDVDTMSIISNNNRGRILYVKGF
jgi:hypothetical protein